MALIVNDNEPRVQYTASASQTVFAYAFAIFEESDLKVYLTPTGSTASDSSDILILTTDYTVTGEGTSVGGNVTLVVAATAGDIITIERDIAVERTSDYTDNGDFLAATFNDDFDKIVMMIQQLEAKLANLALVTQTTSTAGSLTLPVLENDKYLTSDGT